MSTNVKKTACSRIAVLAAYDSALTWIAFLGSWRHQWCIDLKSEINLTKVGRLLSLGTDLKFEWSHRSGAVDEKLKRLDVFFISSLIVETYDVLFFQAVTCRSKNRVRFTDGQNDGNDDDDDVENDGQLSFSPPRFLLLTFLTLFFSAKIRWLNCLFDIVGQFWLKARWFDC